MTDPTPEDLAAANRLWLKSITDPARAFGEAHRAFDVECAEADATAIGRGNSDDATKARLSALSMARRAAHDTLLHALGLTP